MTILPLIQMLILSLTNDHSVSDLDINTITDIYNHSVSDLDINTITVFNDHLCL